MQGSTRIDELRTKFNENPRRYFAPLANEYRKAGDTEQAIAICRAQLAHQPGHMSGHVVYGQALYDAKLMDDARMVFEQALSLDPENMIVLRHLGDIARQRGEDGEARHWYGRALESDPQDPEIAAYVAELNEPVTGAAAESTGNAAGHTEQATTAGEVDEASPSTDPWLSPQPELAAEEARVVERAPAVDDAPAVGGAYFVDEAPAVGEAQAIELASADAPGGPIAVPDTPDVPADEFAAATSETTSEAPVNEFADPAPEPTEAEPASPSETRAETTAGESDSAWRETAASGTMPFVTRTMAELYVGQGLRAEAREVFRQLLANEPDNVEIRDRLAELEDEPAVTPDSRHLVASASEAPHVERPPEPAPRGKTVRELFATIAAHRPPARVLESESLARPLGHVFPGQPVSEEDSRAAFALSAAMSAPAPRRIRDASPHGSGAATAAHSGKPESEEDVRKFREWLDNLEPS